MDNAHSTASATAHAANRAPEHRSSDFMAAITGLIVGGCILFALVFGIVELTNRKYAGEAPAPAAASAATAPRP